MLEIVLQQWRTLVGSVATGERPAFTGRTKEAALRDCLAAAVKAVDPGVQVSREVPLPRGKVDLVFGPESEMLAVECKYKLRSDGAATDNRTAAFFDLWKLEAFVQAHFGARGLFLWLTDNSAYLERPSGASRDFRIHHGRVYEPSTLLHADRARNANIPLPMVLAGRYCFCWRSLPQSWWTLEVPVPRPPSGRTVTRA